MSIKTRSLVFATFFGNCIVIGLLVGSLTTDCWLQAIAQKHTDSQLNTDKKQEGKIQFGLFGGTKQFDYGYGLRVNAIDVIDFIKSEPDVMSYWLWLCTALGAGFSLFASAISAVASVIKSASASKKSGTMFLLVISHVASGAGQLLSFFCWMIQFYEYLTHNVLMETDRVQWNTKNSAFFGYSFFFVLIAFAIVVFNLVLLSIAMRIEKRERHPVEPIVDEKMEGAIMLY